MLTYLLKRFPRALLFFAYQFLVDCLLQNIDNLLTSAYNHIQMGKLKFTLSNILFWVSIIASCLLLENVAFLTNNLSGGLDNTSFFMLFALAMIGYISYFIVDHIKNKSRIDYVLLAVMIIGLGVSLVSTWSFKGISFDSTNPDYNFNYVVSSWDQIRQSLSLLIFFTTLYAVLFFFNKNYPSIRKLSLLFIIIMIICYVSVVYSLVAEHDLYVDIFKNIESTKEMQSLFWNPNMFAGFLLMGIASSMGLNYFKKNVFSYISIPFFFIFIVFIGSLTSIAIAAVGTFVYFLVEIIYTIVKKPRRGILFLAIFLVTVIGAYILFACALQLDLGGFSTFCRYLKRKIVVADYQTFTNRKFLWESSFSLLKSNPLNLIFGYGFRNAPIVLGGYKSTIRFEAFAPISSHSGYIQIFMNFGIIGLVIYGAFILYYLYCFIRLLRKDTRFALIYFIIGGIFLGYASMESVIYFNPNVQGFLVGVIFFLPMINKYKHYKHRELGDDVLSIEKPPVLADDLITRSMAKIFMGLTIVCCSLYAFEMFREVEFNRYILLNVIVVLIIFTLFFPFIISSQSKHKGRLPFIVVVTLNITAIVGIFAYLIARYYQKSEIMANDSKWVYSILLFIVLISEVLFYIIFRKRSFKEYLQTFIGTTKLSFTGLIGVAIPVLVVVFLKDRIEVSALTLIVYPVISLMLYFMFSYVIPFGDLKDIVNQYNDLAIYSLKKDVVKDRLEAMNVKRRN